MQDNIDIIYLGRILIVKQGNRLHDLLEHGQKSLSLTEASMKKTSNSCVFIYTHQYRSISLQFSPITFSFKPLSLSLGEGNGFL